MAEVTKGTRVRVVKGRKYKDVVGTVFWTGPDKFKEGGTRLGLHADGGDTAWVPLDYVEVLEKGDPNFAEPEAAPAPEKGSTVFFDHEGERTPGTVFWVGEGRNGGFRVGVRVEGEDDAVWLDARQILTDGEDPSTPVQDDDIPF